MKQALNGKRVAILAADGFEESELSVPCAALQKEGIEVQLLEELREERHSGQHA